MQIELLLGAQIDFLKIYEQRGDAFYRSVESVMSRLSQFPESGPVHRRPYRRMLLLNTPLGLFYTVEGGRVFIHAIVDLRMSPARIWERLTS